MNKLMRYLLLIIAALLSTTVMAATWHHAGSGGWRTHDGHGGWVMRDQGYARHVNNIHECKQLCEQDHQCKGVEFVTEHQHGRPVYTCEVHYDDYAHCDQSGGSRLTGDDGCHVKRADSTPPPSTDEPTDTGGRDHDGKCYAWDWKRISFGNHNWPIVRVDQHEHHRVKAAHISGSEYFDVTVQHDCTISLRSHQNHKYVSNWDTNHYQLIADGDHIGDEDRYKVYKHHDGRYLFKSVKYHSWVYTDHQGYLKSHPQTPGYSHWDERRYKVTKHP